jgi:hypothetical protein
LGQQNNHKNALRDCKAAKRLCFKGFVAPVSEKYFLLRPRKAGAQLTIAKASFLETLLLTLQISYPTIFRAQPAFGVPGFSIFMRIGPPAEGPGRRS